MLTSLTPPGAPDPGPGSSVVLFPYAGGAPRAYQHVAGHLRDHRVDAVTYPGRDHLLDTGEASSIQTLARQVADEVLSRPDADDSTVLLVGHSLGAFVAYETALALAGAERHSRVVLVASGQNPPLPRGTVPVPCPMTDTEIVADIVRQNPASRQVWADEALRDFFLPAVRADYRLLREYRPSGGAVEEVHLVVADDDTEVDHSVVGRWQEFSHRALRVTRVSGGHMYLQQDGRLLAAVVQAAVAAGPPAPDRRAREDQDDV
nr:alpha/beta fold hydrolase [Arsenicicoccus dermatophilus]